MISVNGSARRGTGNEVRKGERHDTEGFVEQACTVLDSTKVTLHADICYDDDTATFGYPEKFGVINKLQFKLDHFTGARFGLFIYSTKEAGGSANFSNFVY